MFTAIKSSAMFPEAIGLNLLTPTTLLLLSVSTLCLYTIGIMVYNIYLHPLSSYPGPKLAAATRLWHINQKLSGRCPYTALSLHRRYGSVVRIAPNELIYTDAAAWNDIYGFRSGKSELQKDPVAYGSIGPGSGVSIIRARRDRHAVLREQLSYGFSKKALREQEGIIRGYADLCIGKLRGHGKAGEAIDMVKWLNVSLSRPLSDSMLTTLLFFTFDVMGDLVFSESFNCLNSSDYHTWVASIFGAIKMSAYLQAALYFPIFEIFLLFLAPKRLKQKREAHREMGHAKAAYRKSQGWQRPDLMSGFLKPDSGVTDAEYRAACMLLIVAGSETTATLMSGATYLLLANPDKLGKVVEEVRGVFASPKDINLVSVNKLDYLLACLTEASRIYPPVPDALSRNTGDNAEIVCGKEVPPHTALGVHHWATYHSPENFAHPDEFIPERWLDDNPEFASDNKASLQPFSVGPRNCVGRNLAYFEMRLMMALLLYTFDLTLQPESRNWTDQNMFILWEKKPLMVKLTPRKN